MKETPDQTILRVIDRLKDVLDKGNRAEKRQLAELLGHDEVSVYCALCEVEDSMQERFDLSWNDDDDGGDSSESPEILPFPLPAPVKKKRSAKN
jgi:hypothetical protein